MFNPSHCSCLSIAETQTGESQGMVSCPQIRQTSQTIRERSEGPAFGYLWTPYKIYHP